MTKSAVILAATSLVMLLALVASASDARADIFQWEYVNPADPR